MRGIKTIAANLANRINQQHYVEHYLINAYNAGVRYARNGAYTIAPLDWGEEEFHLRAKGLCDFRYIVQYLDSASMYSAKTGAYDPREMFPTLDEAKAYCQAHHEAQVKKLLLPA